MTKKHLLLPLLPLPILAQEVLPELVVTASRTLPQAFLAPPGVLVQQTTTAHGSPYIRGFTDRQDNLSLLAASDTQRIPTNGTPSYITTALYAGWQVNDSHQLNLALENLTDIDYRIHGSGQNQLGRNATISVKY